MKIRFEWLFMGVVGVVAVSVLFAWTTATKEVDLAEQFVPAAPVEMPSTSAGQTVAKTDAQQVAVADARAAAVPMADGMQVPMITSETERAETLEQRKSALPRFLAVANENIAKVQSDIELAKANGTDALDVAAMEARLLTMQRVREQVLARNEDIRTDLRN